MSLLAATTTQTASEMSSHDKTEVVGKCAIELSPALKLSNSAARSALLALAGQLFRINHALLMHLVFVGSITVLQIYHIAKDLASVLGDIAWSTWNSSQGRRLRKKLEFEFFVLILGCGNSLCLAVFWPGWFIIGLLYLTWTALGFLTG
ncbi:hypothetical protein KVR01_009007 [Diaporthe batatas]|uniref:uncharacterized protein n=1 Tax=Diaporthe batatas TaxID=748121 RepID=UPI001D03A133|nr:uncharacterized protein KVR01_009007 [Diaporthe batatas]KAG8160743.1 hypothetical protein KVR01_009007 [Diaporthe batatas]